MLWRYPRKGSPALGTIDNRPGVAAHKVHVPSADRHLYALDAATGTYQRSDPQAGQLPGTPTSPVFLDGVVYFGSGNQLYAVQAQTGEDFIRP